MSTRKRLMIELTNNHSLAGKDYDYKEKDKTCRYDPWFLCFSMTTKFFKLEKKVQDISIILQDRKTVNSYFITPLLHYNRIEVKKTKATPPIIRFLFVYSSLDKILGEQFSNGCYISIKDSAGKTIEIKDATNSLQECF